jgi:hypothetical protein
MTSLALFALGTWIAAKITQVIMVSADPAIKPPEVTEGASEKNFNIALATTENSDTLST